MDYLLSQLKCAKCSSLRLNSISTLEGFQKKELNIVIYVLINNGYVPFINTITYYRYVTLVLYIF